MCLLLATTVFVYGQKREVNNAYSSYQNGFLDRAKDAIDKAILNDETAKEARTWLYRGNIYLRLADIRERDFQWQRAKEDSLKLGRPAPVLTRDQQNEKAYLNLCNNCAEVAYDAYMKALELDRSITVSNMGVNNPEKGLSFCASFMFNDAVRLFTDKKYEEAYSLLVKANTADGKLEYVMFWMGYTAEVMGQMENAKTNYNDMIRKKTKDIRVYQQLANIYKTENDTAKVLNVMKAGEPIFFVENPKDPKDPKENMKDTLYRDFVLVYSLFVSWAGKTDDAREIINQALEKYPDNHIFLISYGTALSDDGYYTEAEKYLKKALEMKPDDVTAIFNLGTCYFNNSISITKSLSSIDDQGEYDRLKAAAADLLKMACTQMEKAHEMDPKDRKTLIDLKQIYTRMGKYEELEAINKKIEELK